MKNRFYKKSGFTLIELSISILIISLLIAGFFSMINGSIAKNKINKTNNKITKIYKAIGVFLANNTRLPCPASLNESMNTSATFGQEIRPSSGVCGNGNDGVYKNSNISYGLVPISSLNLSSDFAVDEFGNKISYIVDQRFTGDFQLNPVKNTSSFGTANVTNSILTVREKQSDGTSYISLGDKVLMIILSHGPNGQGSFNVNNSTQNSSVNLEDKENIVITTNNPNFDFNFTINSYADDKFDDIMLYKTRSDFVTDFSMQNLIACFIEDIEDTGGTGNFGSNSVYNGQQLFYSSSCDTQVDPGQSKPIKNIKCNLNGQWLWLYQFCF